jgi:DNA polymerase III delta prime subunit
MASPVPGKTAPRLFISYSHDSREHEDRVRAIADRLREDGIDAIIDQYDTAPSAGWPMWMDREIQKADFVALVCTETYLKRVEGRELPGKGRGVLWEATIIYNRLNAEDTTVQRFIPILLKGGTPSYIPWPARGVAHYQVDTDDGYEDFYRHLTAQPRHEKPGLGKLKSLPAIEPQSYPASLEGPTQQKAPTRLDRRNRLQMLKRVRLDWIDGVLKQSLYQVARIDLELQTKSDAVEQPLKAIVQTADQPSTVIPAGTAISQIFDDHGNALLILGAPGTGKTTLLLELAEQLLDRAEKDEEHPMPVVFNLSSWAVRRRPLHEWLITELNERSDVPKRVAQHWVETEQIIPLLDGLDEVSGHHRQACAEAINDFRRDHGLLPIAVCSRVADYESLATKLRLRTAITVQALTKLEIQHYLERIGELLHGLREALKKDPSLWELLETPLMLWVAMLAYRNAPAEFAVADTLEQRRTRLFANFVDAMFHRRSLNTRYTPKQAISWLCWLAATLEWRHHTVFYLEKLHEEWLRTPLLIALSIPLSMVPMWLATLVGIQLFKNGLGRSDEVFLLWSGGLIIGLPSIVIGLMSALRGNAIPSRKPNQETHISIRRALASGMISGIAAGLIAGLKAGLGAGLCSLMIFGGYPALRHLVIRLLLWRNRSAPLHYVRFLDYAVERLFLRKVGGGYIFTHRTLLEYFASLQEKPQSEPNW